MGKRREQATVRVWRSVGWMAGLLFVPGAALLAAESTANSTKSGELGRPPNVVVILADDLGWGDLGCHQGTTPTPHLDRFFAEGIELRTFLVTPVCSPSRAAFLTGRNPVRVGVAPMTVNMDKGGGLRDSDVTLAEAFRMGGYATACIGKWHLGITPKPNGQGFDEFRGCLGAAVYYDSRKRQRDQKLDWWLNDKPLAEPGYTTDIITQHAVEYIHRPHTRPFFLYVPFTAVHKPLQATEAYLKRVPKTISDPDARTYAAMTLALDDGVSAILEALDAASLAENTVVVFASDNGAAPTGSNLPFRGGKHTLYEGGVRSPTAIRWPGRLKGGRQVDALLTIEDLYPTLLTLAGVKMPQGVPLDGRDFSPLILNDRTFERDHHCWLWRNCDGIRTRRWKLLRFVDHRELYDLQADPGESKNLFEKFPKQARELETKLDAWEASVPCAPTHVPVKSAAQAVAQPAGDVLEIRIEPTQGDQKKPVCLTLGQRDSIIQPGDRLEYDLFIAEDSLKRGFFIDQAGKPQRPNPFGQISAVDQYGTPQQVSQGFPQAEGRWARRVVGLANLCPHAHGSCRLGFVSQGKGQLHLYLDNIVIRRADGSTIDFYRDGPFETSSKRKPEETKDSLLRVVPLSSVAGR